MKTKLHVNLAENSYDIHIQAGLLDDLATPLRDVYQGEKVFVITDRNVEAHFGEKIVSSLTGAGYQVEKLVLEPGEATKAFATMPQVYTAMARAKLTRKDLVLTLGGGVVGDLGGFAAATYLRGLSFVQVPTSLLAQVDSSVGGKVGVDLPQGKNLVGAFYQPKAVLIDPNSLQTLPDRFYRDGMAEVIKYGCIQNEAFFAELETIHTRAQAMERMQHIIATCVDIKREMVEQDERDLGLRMLLNFGHTIGHAVEKCHNFADYTHGEAVAIGMVEMTKRTERHGITPQSTAKRIESLCRQFGLPTQDETADFTRIAEAVTMDKKNLGKTLKIVALAQLGKAVLVDTDPSFLEW